MTRERTAGLQLELRPHPGSQELPKQQGARVFSGLYGNIQHLTVLSPVLFEYNLNPQKTTTAKELTRENRQRD